MKFLAPISKLYKIVFFITLILFVFSKQISAAATCLGESWCENCCDPAVYDHRNASAYVVNRHQQMQMSAISALV